MIVWFLKDQTFDKFRIHNACCPSKSLNFEIFYYLFSLKMTCPKISFRWDIFPPNCPKQKKTLKKSSWKFIKLNFLLFWLSISLYFYLLWKCFLKFIQKIFWRFYILFLFFQERIWLCNLVLWGSVIQRKNSILLIYEFNFWKNHCCLIFNCFQGILCFSWEEKNLKKFSLSGLLINFFGILR